MKICAENASVQKIKKEDADLGQTTLNSIELQAYVVS
jgi:hypothetical protein